MDDLLTRDLWVAFVGGGVFAFVDLEGVVFFGLEDVEPTVVFVSVFFLASVEDGIDEIAQKALEAVVIDGKGMDVLSFHEAADIVDGMEVLEIDEADGKDAAMFGERKQLVFVDQVAGDDGEQGGIKDDASEIHKGGLFEGAFAEELKAEGVGDGLLERGVLEGEFFEGVDGDRKEERGDLGA